MSTAADQQVIHVSVDDYAALIDELYADGFTMCVDLCGVDTLGAAERPWPDGVEAQRFEVVVNLLDLAKRRRVRVRVQVPDSDPAVPSITHVYPGAEAPEREAADLFGIAFDGHPDPTRILMPEGWDGHPLRKDYEIGAIAVQFKATADR